MSIADDHIFAGSQRRQSHRSTSVQFLRADADLGAKPEFEAVGEAGGSVVIDGGGIDFVQEPLRPLAVFRHDTFRMHRSETVDMGDSFVQIADHLDVEHVIVILRSKIIVCCFFQSIAQSLLSADNLSPER